jgi:methionyl-tRNA formyltransferase
MQINAGLDTGDMLLKSVLTIGADETAPELSARLAPLGAEALLETLRLMECGTAHAEKQDEAEASFAPILKKEDGLIDWELPAANIYNRLRGFAPWPGVYTHFRKQQLLVWRARPTENPSGAAPGRMITDKRRLVVACGDGTALEAIEVQLSGKSRMSGEAFVNGHHPRENESVGELA